MAGSPTGILDLVYEIERLIHEEIPTRTGGHLLTPPCNGSITYHIDSAVGAGVLQAVFTCSENEENWLVDLSLASFRHDRQARRVVVSRKKLDFAEIREVLSSWGLLLKS